MTRIILNASIDSEGHRPETAITLQDPRSRALPGAPKPVACVRSAPPEVWVVLTHAVGDNDQCLALAEALGRPFRSISLDWPASGKAFDRAQLKELLQENARGRMWRASMGLHAPWPRMVICCGRRADGLAFWIKRQSGERSRVVTIGRAHAALANYDLVVASPQYLLPERANVIHLPISMARGRTEVRLEAPADPVMAPKPWFTLLLGGRVKQFVAGEGVLRQVALLTQLAADRCGGSVIVLTSRRTPPCLLAAVESELTSPIIYRWSSRNAGGLYMTLLRRSAAVFVTGDSTSMIRDACHSGAPTYLIELPDRMEDIRGLWRRSLYGVFRKAGVLLRNFGLRSMAEAVDHAQDWLHAERILRYPRDLRRFHAKVYEMGMARPAADFDPSAIPARRDIGHPLDAPDVDAPGVDAPGVQVVVDRCMTWLSPNP